MQKLQDYWAERSSKQKIILAVVFVTTFMFIASFSWLASRPSMSLLYGGLDPAQAGEVVSGVERSGVVFEVRGDSIWVESSQRDRLRVDLASQGLPAAGGAGYELLDGMSGFGTTAQMFDAAYWRAKEGELARTILALPNVKTARVHLAVENGRGYRREFNGSASVTLATNGATISRDQASALKYLVSSGVPGMQPENVTVIDTRHGIIGAEEDRAGADRAAELKRNVERILESHVGMGNAIVEVNLDVVTESEQLTEQRIDPEQRAVISQVTEESSDQSTSSGSGAVTAASNLPDTEEAPGDRNQSERSENRQQTNFEVSSLTREVLRQPGAIRRQTVAVLVNGVVQEDANGELKVTPRTDAELEVLRELVSSAVGYDEERGDIVTVKSLPFADLVENGTLAQPSLLQRLELNELARIALIGFFALAMLLVVFRSTLRKIQPASGPAILDESDAESDDPFAGGFATATIYENDDTLTDPESLVTPLPLFGDPSDEDENQQSEHLALPSADPVDRLRSLMRERQEESVKILAGWIANKEKA